MTAHDFRRIALAQGLLPEAAPRPAEPLRETAPARPQAAAEPCEDRDADPPTED